MEAARKYLNPINGGFAHWCPGCEGMHVISTAAPYTVHWSFNGNTERPTFGPSVKITYNGPDADRARDGGRRAPSACCHYFLTDGQLQFCGDSTHALAGQTVPLPALPPEYEDWGS